MSTSLQGVCVNRRCLCSSRFCSFNTVCVTVVIHCIQSLLDASNPTCLLWPQSSKQWQDYIFYSNIQQFNSNIIPRLIKPFWELTLIFKEEKTKSRLLGFVALLQRMKEDVFQSGPPTCLWFYFHCRRSSTMKNAERKQSKVYFLWA